VTTTLDTRPTPASSGRRKRSGWRLSAGLIALNLVPALAGSVRVVQLASGAEVTDANRRFFDSPFPVVAHIVGAIAFGLAGALQFAKAFRRRRPRWHRAAGRVVAPAGIVVALTGLWMTGAYDLPPADNALLGGFRYAAGTAMLASIVAALASLRMRRYRNHGAWMARAYAIGLGAGTQVFTSVAWLALVGEPSPTTRAWLMFAGWAINIAVVECTLRRRAKLGSRRSRHNGGAYAGRI
jgi:hypothetical protein